MSRDDRINPFLCEDEEEETTQERDLKPNQHAKIPKSADWRPFVEYYFYLSYDYDKIVLLLKSRHDVSVSVRTLKRRLSSCGLKKGRNNPCQGDKLRELMTKELNTENHNVGIVKMMRLLAVNHHVWARKLDVLQLMKELDLEGLMMRQKKQIKRIAYYSEGPNESWCSDGHDKTTK
jgi:hypothetical protein